tara:strand:- start:5246 stop:6070 length:825 start_codon:yes stop_codon:yes gene_type:complete
MKFEEFKERYSKEDIIKIGQAIETTPGGVFDYVKSLQGTPEYDLLVEVVRALAVFTGGDVEAIRDPEAFDIEKATDVFDHYRTSYMVKLLRGFSGAFKEKKPTVDNLKISSYILKVLAMSKAKKPKSASRELYRGMNSLSANAFLALCKPGAVYSLGKVVSTSLDKGTAEMFETDGKRFGLVYVLDNSKAQKGVYTGGASSVYAREGEVIVSGKIKIKSFEMTLLSENEVLRSAMGDKIASFEQLVEFVGLIEGVVEDKFDNVIKMFVYAEVLP